MKKLLIPLTFILCFSAALKAQERAEYQSTRTNHVLTDSAKRAIAFFGLPTGTGVSMPSYVPDSVKNTAVRLLQTSNSYRLMHYNPYYAGWEDLGIAANPAAKQPDSAWFSYGKLDSLKATKVMITSAPVNGNNPLRKADSGLYITPSYYATHLPGGGVPLNPAANVTMMVGSHFFSINDSPSGYPRIDVNFIGGSSRAIQLAWASSGTVNNQLFINSGGIVLGYQNGASLSQINITSSGIVLKDYNGIGATYFTDMSTTGKRYNNWLASWGAVKSRIDSALTVVGTVGYVTPSSTNTFTNKAGNISQWTNDLNYATRANISDSLTAHGATPGAGITYASNIIAVDQGYAFTWSGAHTFNNSVALNGAVTSNGNGITLPITAASYSAMSSLFTTSHSVNQLFYVAADEANGGGYPGMYAYSWNGAESRFILIRFVPQLAN